MLLLGPSAPPARSPAGMGAAAVFEQETTYNGYCSASNNSWASADLSAATA